MKRYIISLIVLLFAVSNLYSQTGWYWQNPLPQGNTLYSIRKFNDNVLFTVGSFGTLLKTSNGGMNWFVINSNIKKKFNSIYALSEDTLIVCGDSGMVLKSNNGGINWVTEQRITSSNLKDIEFFDSNTGIISGTNGTILKTTNKGNNWISVATGTTSTLFCTAIVDANSALVGGSGSVFKTTDKGSSWNNICTWTGREFMSIMFLNKDTAFAAGDYVNYPQQPSGRVFRTNNGGSNWIEIGLSNSFSCYDVHFLNSNTGYVTGVFGIAFTPNGGINWSFKNSNIFYSSTTTNSACFAVGEGGNIMKSIDYGSNWSANTSLYGVWMNYDISFPNVNTGYVCSADSLILKTTNGGIAWNTINSPRRVLFSIFFTDAYTGYTVGGSNGVYKTTDGGNNWMLQQINAPHGFTYINFLNQNTGFAGGYYSDIYKTTNGGLNWIIKYSGTFGTIYSISFPDSTIGYAVDADFGMLRTTDGGDSWFYVHIDNVFSMYSIHFLNPGTGFITGTYRDPVNYYYSSVFKTTDFGQSWTRSLTINSLYTMWDIGFSSNNIGYVVCEYGKIFKTFDGGDNWFEQNSITDNRLCALSVLSDSIVYAVGNYRNIIKTTTGGGNPIGIQPIFNEIPNGYVLHQNYPNPFNPSTKIIFDLPKSGNTKLVIYDVLGREVATLVNEQLKPGSYEVEWDGSNYASGIYFYQLITESAERSRSVETKRMVLIK